MGKSSNYIQYPFVFYEGNIFLTFTISSATVSRHDEKSIKIHSEGGHPKNRQVLCFSPREKYINIPSGKYIYVHKYVYICVYTYLCKMDEYRYYAGLS